MSSPAGAGFTAPGDRRFPTAVASWALDNFLRSALSLDSSNTDGHLTDHRYLRFSSVAHWVDWETRVVCLSVVVTVVPVAPEWSSGPVPVLVDSG